MTWSWWQRKDYCQTLVPIELDLGEYSVCSRFYQWYQWHTNIIQGSTNGTIGKIIGTNGNANGTNGKPMVPFTVKPMLPLASNGTIGIITNGTIGKPRTEPLFAGQIRKDLARKYEVLV